MLCVKTSVLKTRLAIPTWKTRNGPGDMKKLDLVKWLPNQELVNLVKNQSKLHFGSNLHSFGPVLEKKNLSTPQIF